MQKCLKTVLVYILFLFLAGCWNNRDLTDLAIMTGIAVDKSENGNIEMTVQVVKPEALKLAGEGGGKTREPFINISSSGITMFDAARNLLAKLNKKAYFAQVQLFVISEEAARDGISDYFDLFERDTETRRRAYVLIAKGMKAKTVLDSESRLANLPTTHNVEALDASKSYGKTLKVTIIDVLKDFSKKSYDIVLPVLYNSKASEDVYQEDLIMEGSAIIKKDKLIGFLDPYQTRGYLFARDMVKSTIINVPCPLNKEKVVSIEVIRSKGKIEAKMNNGKLVLGIEVNAEGNIGEQQEKADLTKPDTIEVLEDEVENAIRKEIIETLKAAQEEYRSDIFGFIDEIYKDYYKEWKSIAANWCDIYSNTIVDVKVRFVLRNSGLIKQPVNPK